jgi:hypothetical protein
MEKITTQDALRYVMTGFALLLFLFVWDPEATENLINKLGPVGIVACAISIGALIYVIYRALVYNIMIVWLQDKFRSKKNPNYRTFLKEKYNLNTTEEARQLYVYLRDKHFRDRAPTVRTTFAGIHYAYMVGLIGIVFTAAAPFFCRGQLIKLYLPFSLVTLFAAFIFDRRGETDEYLALLSLEGTIMDNDKERLLG